METTSATPTWLDNVLENEELPGTSLRHFLWNVQAGNDVACCPSITDQHPCYAEVHSHNASLVNEEHCLVESAPDCGLLDLGFVEDLLLGDPVKPAKSTLSCHDVWTPDDSSVASAAPERASLTCGGTVREFVNSNAVTHLPCYGKRQLLQSMAIGDEGHGGAFNCLSSAGDHFLDATPVPEEFLEPKQGFKSVGFHGPLPFKRCDTSDLKGPGIMEDPSWRTSSQRVLQEAASGLCVSGVQITGSSLPAQSVSSSNGGLAPSFLLEKNIPHPSELQRRSQHLTTGLATDNFMSGGTMGGEDIRQIPPWQEQLGCSWSTPFERSEDALDAMAACQETKWSEGRSSWDVLGVPESQTEQHRLHTCSASAGAAAATVAVAGTAAEGLEDEFEVKGRQACLTKYESNMGEARFQLSGSMEMDSNLLSMQRELTRSLVPEHRGRQQELQSLEVHSLARGDVTSSRPACESGSECSGGSIAHKQGNEGEQRRHLLELEDNGSASQRVSDGGAGDDGGTRRTVPNLSMRLASIIDNLGQKQPSGGRGGGLKGEQKDRGTGFPEATENTERQVHSGSDAGMQVFVPPGTPAAAPLPKGRRRKRQHKDLFPGKAELSAQASHVPTTFSRDGSEKQPTQSSHKALTEDAQEILHEWAATQSMHMRILVAVDCGKQRLYDHEDWQQKVFRNPSSGVELKRIVPLQLSAPQAYPSVDPGTSVRVLSLEGLDGSGARSLQLNGPRLYTERDIKENLLALATAHVTLDKGKVDALERTLLPYANRWGSGLQRLCFHFLNALRIRTRGMGEAGSSSGYFQRWLPPVAKSGSEQKDQDFLLADAAQGPDMEEDISEALTDSKMAYFATTPFVRWFFAATSSVLLRMIGLRKRIHIIDFGFMLGAQWIKLIGQLKSRACGPPTSFRITTVVNQARNELFHPSTRKREREIIAALHRDLERATKSAGIKEFKFKVVTVEPTALMELWAVQGRRQDCSSSREGDDQEFLAVRGCIDLEFVPDSSVVRANPRDTVLMWVRDLEPEVFLLMGHELDGNNPFFLSRCRGCLDFYASAFNCHDQTVLGTTSKALLFEENFHGMNIANVVACEGLSRLARGEQEGQWRARLKRLGFHVMEGGFDAALQDELYRIVRDGPEGWGMKVSQSAVEFLWKGKSLVFISLWHG